MQITRKKRVSESIHPIASKSRLMRSMEEREIRWWEYSRWEYRKGEYREGGKSQRRRMKWEERTAGGMRSKSSERKCNVTSRLKTKDSVMSFVVQQLFTPASLGFSFFSFLYRILSVSDGSLLSLKLLSLDEDTSREDEMTIIVGEKDSVFFNFLEVRKVQLRRPGV